jgi:hypothetical protein
MKTTLKVVRLMPMESLEIREAEGTLLAIIVQNENEMSDGIDFFTTPELELQVASINRRKGSEIPRHFHPAQNRELKQTSEVIVILDGLIEVDIYSNDLCLHSTHRLSKGEIIYLISGGHGFRIIDNAKFIEVKQGPFDEHLDKIFF